jgi:hypothetical protein
MINPLADSFVLQGAHKYALYQTSLYEQFLNGLEGLVFGFRLTNEEVSARAVRRLESAFERRKNLLIELLSQRDREEGLYVEFDPSVLEIELFRTYALTANFATFKGNVRFGDQHFFNAFDLHGGFGYLAQEKAAKIDWTVRNKAGASSNALRTFYLEHRDFAYQGLLDRIVRTYRPETVLFIVTKDGEKIRKITADDLRDRNGEIRKNYFHINSTNSIIFDDTL